MTMYAYGKCLPVAMLVLLLSVGCSKGAEEALPFQIGEAKLQIHNIRKDAFWIDNSTLVFAAADNGPDEQSNMSKVLADYPDEKAHIYVWKMGGAPEPYKADVWPQPGTTIPLNYLCAAEGEISYSTQAFKPALGGFEVAAMKGVLGREAPVTLRYIDADDRWSRSPGYRAVGKRCDQFHSPAMAGRAWQVSYLRDQILDMGPARPSPSWSPQPLQIPATSPFQLVSTSDGRRISIPTVDPNWVEPSCTETLSWERAFVAWRCLPGEVNKTIALFPIWKIRSDGTTEKSEADLKDWSSAELVPFRDGYLFTSAGRYDSTEDDAGILLLEGGNLRRIATGHYRALAISPNGCLGAFAKSMAFGFGASLEHLTIFDLCRLRG